jgi:hypothetical protein
MSIILPKSQANLLFRTSWFSLISCIYAIKVGYYDWSICTGGVFIFSINYWRHPDYSWRRYVDITYVNAALFYQVFTIYYYRAQYRDYYSLCLLIAVLCYIQGILQYNKKNYVVSTYYHAGLHLFANVANIILYSGKRHIA